MTSIAAGVAAASITGGIAYGLVEQASYEREAKREAADYAKHAAHKISQTCAVVAKTEKPLCLLKAQEEYELEARRNRHDASDLVAQRKSGLWTSIMGVAALVGMALSAVGVALVWITFREQRRTNDLAQAEAERARGDARESAANAKAALAIAERNADASAALVEAYRANGVKQIRCYVSGVSARVGYVEKGDSIVCCTIKNSGQSPALKTRCTAKLSLFAGTGLNKQLHQSKSYSTIQDIPSGGEEEIEIGDYQLIFRDEETAPFRAGQPALLALDVTINATDVFGETVSSEDRFIVLLRKVPNPGWLELKRGSKVALPEQTNPTEREGGL